MSVQSMAWALDHRQTGPLPAEARLALVSLADYTDPTGRNAWPSASTLAHRLGVTTRSVRRALALLEDAGLIRRGDQQAVAHMRADRRPIVWDLALDGVQVTLKITGEAVELGAEPYDPDAHAVTGPSPRRLVDNQARGDSGGRHGVTATSPNLRTNPSIETSNAVEVTTRRASATASMAVPREPGAPIRSIGITDADCPTCGVRVYRNHRCRSSALDPTSPNHQATVRELYLAVPPPPDPPQAPTLDIVLGEVCAWCGRKAPTNDQHVCLRCMADVARVGPHHHPIEDER